jgi:hypothetical protein
MSPQNLRLQVSKTKPGYIYIFFPFLSARHVLPARLRTLTFWVQPSEESLSKIGWEAYIQTGTNLFTFTDFLNRIALNKIISTR